MALSPEIRDGPHVTRPRDTEGREVALPAFVFSASARRPTSYARFVHETNFSPQGSARAATTTGPNSWSRFPRIWVCVYTPLLAPAEEGVAMGLGS